MPTEDDKCTCGAIIDADGNCPYCDYVPAEEDREFRSWFDLIDLFYGDENEPV